MIPVHMLTKKEPVLLSIACAAVKAVSHIAVYYIPLYLQFTRGDNAIEADVRMLPFVVLLIAVMLSSDPLVGRWGYYKPL